MAFYKILRNTATPLVCSLASVFVLAGAVQSRHEINNGQSWVYSEYAPPKSEIRIAVAGDTMMGSAPSGILPPEHGIHLFDDVKSYMQDADAAFLNLEGPLCDSGTPSKFSANSFVFRTPKRYAHNLMSAGIDVVSIANNHSRDFGGSGFEATKKALASVGIGYLARDAVKIKTKGAPLRFLSFAYGDGFNDINNLEEAKKIIGQQSPDDIVVVSFHGGAEGNSKRHVPQGHEYFLGEDRGDLRRFAHSAVDAGADLVIGHGPHVLRGMEVYEERLIAYSLGNFATYGGFNLEGACGIGAVLIAELTNDGAFKGGRIVSTYQVLPGGPKLDNRKMAVGMIRELSLQDFGESAPLVKDDGSLVPRARVVR